MGNVNFMLLSSNYEVYKKYAPKGFVEFTTKHGVKNPNTCAVRLSSALKHADRNFFVGVEAPLEWKKYDLPTRAADLAKILNKKFGKAELIKGGSAELSGRKGVIFFDFKAPLHDGATGHISVWDGKNVVDGGDYFKAPRVYFWDLN